MPIKLWGFQKASQQNNLETVTNGNYKEIYIYIQDNSSKIKTKHLQMRMIEKYLQKDIYISRKKTEKYW